jgi:hypothetical protein
MQRFGDGNEGVEADRKPLGHFIEELIAATTDMGFPCFLRTDHTSAKHSWEDTCFVKSVSDLMGHVYQIAECSETPDMIGMPWDTWVVREFLPTMPIGVCEGYGNMPVCKEFRYFIEDGRYCCSHPYWPREALIDGGLDVTRQVYDALCAGRTQELDRIAIDAGAAVGGAWSVDILETQRGWIVVFPSHRPHLRKAQLERDLLRALARRSSASSAPETAAAGFAAAAGLKLNRP